MIRESIQKVVMGESLSESEMEKTMEEVIVGRVAGKTPGLSRTSLRGKQDREGILSC